MISRRRFVAGSAAALLPLPAAAQASAGRVRDVVGLVTLNRFPVSRQTLLQWGQTLETGANGQVWFTIGSDAFFLRPNSRLRLDGTRPSEPIIDFLRLVTGAIGATFQRGARRQVVTPTATIGIRGTGVYVESYSDATYACTCFGTTDINSSTGAPIDSVAVSTDNHQARIIRPGVVLARGMERHTSEEMIQLEGLVGRPNPFTR